MPSALAPGELLARVQRDAERSVLRARNGLKYFTAANPPNVGRTPKDTIWTRDKIELWRYRSDRVQYHPPVLLIMSLVTRNYILDLYPGNSIVEHLRNAGFDVFMIDWGVPDQLEANNTLETYVDQYLPAVVERISQEVGKEGVSLLGYCFGGVLAYMFAAAHPELPIRNVVTLATPVDFSKLGLLTYMTTEERLKLEDSIDETGNVPAELLHRTFRLLKPTADLVQYANLWQNLWNDDYMEGYQAMGKWVNDHIPFPGAAAHQTVDKLMRENALVNGTFELGGRPVKLESIRASFLNVVAEKDHICPVEATEALPDLVGADDAQELRLSAGHAGLVAGRTAAKVTMPGIVEWLSARSEPVAGRAAS
jgi:polyhydroxyalkanoate synthase subunit PhaC